MLLCERFVCKSSVSCKFSAVSRQWDGEDYGSDTANNEGRERFRERLHVRVVELQR